MNVGTALAETVLAAAIVVLLWYLSSWAQAADQRVLRVTMQLDPLAREQIRSVVFSGYADGLALRNRSFDTVYSARQNYVPLGGNGAGGVSGGSDFSYSFWCTVRNPTAIAESPVPVTLFSKGDPRVYTTWDMSDVSASSKRAELVKCPLVRLEANRKGIRGTLDVVIQLNMSEDPHAEVVVSGNPSDDPTSRDNLMSLITGNWSLWTLSVTDYVDEDKRIVGTAVNFYINDVLVKSTEFPGQTPIQNIGDLNLFPPQVLPGTGVVRRFPSDEALGSLFVADMLFTTPSMTLADIQKRLTEGVPNTVAVVSAARPTDIATLALGATNVLNLSNT